MSTAMEPVIEATTHSDSLFLHQSHSFRHFPEPDWIFDELPQAYVVSVSRPDTGDISPILLSYTIELQYKQGVQRSYLFQVFVYNDHTCSREMTNSLSQTSAFKWLLNKKASQVLYLHFALKRRAIIEELHEKQEQVREWLHSLGIVDHLPVVQDGDEPDDGALPVNQEDSVRNRHIPTKAALPILRPSLGGQQAISERSKVAMQNYLNHFLGNLDIVNSREVCKFLEVSKLSFSREYGPKMKEGYIMVKHLSKVSRQDDSVGCFPCQWFGCCINNWEKVWAVLKPGFLALLEDPFETKPLDVIFFDVLPTSNGSKAPKICLANQLKDRSFLHYSFEILSGCWNIELRTSSSGKVKEWVASINDAALRPPEGWCHPHQFGSFAPQRGLTEDGSQAQWFVDGLAAFDAIASAIEDAKSEIFITGWWLCPELYLRRPFRDHSISRLDNLLEAKAKQGVQIYILLYKEVSVALKINSMYSKKVLQNIHENIRVLRYPNHLSTGIYLWSHHEKVVIVDHQICFIGGLDLCFGRFDTIEHIIGDCPPNVWPGKDYYNPRESEPNSWEDAMEDELDRRKYPRMPWHDVHCALWGPPCSDIARHFVQRWNHAKLSKAPGEKTIPLLMPHHHMVLPHYLGRSREIDIEKSENDEENKQGISRQDFFSSLSPMQDIPLLLPHEADTPVAHSVYNKLTDNNLLNQPTRLPGRFSFVSPKLHILVPSTPAKDSNDELDFVDITSNMQSDDWLEASDKDDHAGFAEEYGQVGPRVSCHCQVIRSVSQWSAGVNQPEESIHNAYCSLIEKAEHFVYIENQFFISGLHEDEVIQNRVLEALYRRILLARKEQKCFRVVVVIPLLPGFQGGVDDGGAATVRAIMHWQYRTISREKNSILYNLNALFGPKTQDYISFYGLRTHGRLFEGGPVATSQVYVHSKVIIVDDRVAIIGSSNINDRSLLGSRDSEIGVVIEDKEFIDSSMNGEPWKAGKFTFSLREALWSEHLGLKAGEVDRIKDPVVETTYADLWLATAKENSMIYHDVFACLPNDLIHSRSALRQSMHSWKEKLGHTTIDLGIAPNKLITYEDGEAKKIDPMGRLKSVRGHLVSFPLDFMCQEDLRPQFIESEFYASAKVFH